MDLTPKSQRVAWHLTYRCNLACITCSRACFLNAPQTPDMTLADAREFWRQAKELAWQPTIDIMGGEPTLHPEFMHFVDIAAAFAPRKVNVWSNGFAQQTRAILDTVRAEQLGNVIAETLKPRGSIHHGLRDVFIAPSDFGVKRAPCWAH